MPATPPPCQPPSAWTVAEAAQLLCSPSCSALRLRIWQRIHAAVQALLRPPSAARPSRAIRVCLAAHRRTALLPVTAVVQRDRRSNTVSRQLTRPVDGNDCASSSILRRSKKPVTWSLTAHTMACPGGMRISRGSSPCRGQRRHMVRLNDLLRSSAGASDCVVGCGGVVLRQQAFWMTCCDAMFMSFA